MIDLLQSLVPGLFMISFLVVAHEAGHYVAARLFGVAAPVFSVFIGPTIASFRAWGTEFRLGALPLGGYVMMAGADAFGEEDAEAEVAPGEAFSHKPVWQRLIIMAAGPAVNLVLPVALFTAVLMAGMPDAGTVVGLVAPGSVAEQLGLRQGDAIVAIDGAPVEVWTDVEEAMEAAVGRTEPLRLSLRRGDAAIDVQLDASVLRMTPSGMVDTDAVGLKYYALTPRIGVDDPAGAGARAGLKTGDFVIEVDGNKTTTFDGLVRAMTEGPHVVRLKRRAAHGKAIDDVELTVGEPVAADAPTPEREGDAAPALAAPSPGAAQRPYANPWGVAPVMLFVEEVQEGGPAAQAGVQVGDRLLAVDGVPLTTFDAFVTHVGRTVTPTGGTQPISLEIVRDGEVITLGMTPQLRLNEGEAWERPIIGLSRYTDGLYTFSEGDKTYSLVQAVPRATRMTWEVTRDTAAMIRNLLIGRVDPRSTVGGPVAMFAAADAAVEDERALQRFIGLIAMISISLGLVNLLPVPVLDGGQIVFNLIELVRGRPLSLELRERVQIVSVLGLVVLTVLVFVNDVSRLPMFTP